MKAISPRLIAADELEVLKQALLCAALSHVPEETIRDLIALRVIGECECGCRSIEFEEAQGEDSMMADGVGFLKTGERLNIIVWGRGTSVTSLEIVDHEGSGKLPDASTVCSWEEAGKNAF